MNNKGKDLTKVKTTFRYKPRFAVVIECADEAGHKKAFAMAEKLKMKARLVRV